MDKDAGLIGVEQVDEHEDGSATYKFHMDAHARGLLAGEGLKLVLYCAAAKLDMQVVYDFIEDHMRYENDEASALACLWILKGVRVVLGRCCLL